MCKCASIGCIMHGQDIDAVELFAGDAQLSAGLAELGLRVASVVLRNY